MSNKQYNKSSAEEKKFNGKNYNDTKSSGKVSTNAKRKRRNGRKGSTATGNSAEAKPEVGNYSAITNDPSWWSARPNLLADAIAVSTDFTGTVVNLHLGNTTGPSHWFAAPGFLSYEMYPTFGINKGPSDPLNMGTKQYYAFLRNRKRATKYDSVDLTCYSIALGEIRSFLTFIKRAYTLKNMNLIENRYLYNDILRSMYLDPEDWRNNSYKFLSRWETAQMSIEPYRHPNLAYYDLKDATYRYIYTETPGSLTDQMHIINPAGFYVISHDTDGATKLVFKRWSTDRTYRTIDQAFDFLDKMIDAINNDQSFMAMSADILDSLAPSEIKPWNFQLSDMSIDNIFVFDPIYLYRFRNMPIQSSTLIETDVTQDPTKGFLVSVPKVVIGSSESNFFLSDRKLITTPEWNPNPLVLTEFTMYTPACRKTPTQGTYEVSSGFYFCEKVWLVYTQRDGARKWIKVNGVHKADDATLEILVHLRPFKYCPRLMFHVAGDGGKYDDSSFVYDYVDSDAICVMENKDLMNLHNAVMMNAFSVQLNNLQTDSRIMSVPTNSSSTK